MTHASLSSPGLSRLSEVPLSESHLALLEESTRCCLGSAPFRNRKKAELRELLALCQVSGRIKILAVNLEDALQVVLAMRCPVPVMGDDGVLHIANQAHIHLGYPEAALSQPQAGYAFIQIIQPRGVWLPNVSPATASHRPLPVQALCLGASLAPGIRVRELVLMTYGALTLQTVQMDVLDAAGLMNPRAADWWQHNLSQIPLTTEPFVTA